MKEVKEGGCKGLVSSLLARKTGGGPWRNYIIAGFLCFLNYKIYSRSNTFYSVLCKLFLENFIALSIIQELLISEILLCIGKTLCTTYFIQKQFIKKYYLRNYYLTAHLIIHKSSNSPSSIVHSTVSYSKEISFTACSIQLRLLQYNCVMVL